PLAQGPVSEIRVAEHHGVPLLAGEQCRRLAHQAGKGLAPLETPFGQRGGLFGFARQLVARHRHLLSSAPCSHPASCQSRSRACAWAEARATRGAGRHRRSASSCIKRASAPPARKLSPLMNTWRSSYI